jgi:hypothetical protein
MKQDNEVGFLDLIGALNRLEIRHLIVGRRAVILYGAPVLTADHDLWIHPEDKKKTLLLLDRDLSFELSHPPQTRRPIVTAYSGMKKYDLFFHRRIKNLEDAILDFETCYANSTLIEDEEMFFRVPSIHHLIQLKKIRAPNVKDEQDIAYLLKAKQILKATKR